MNANKRNLKKYVCEDCEVEFLDSSALEGSGEPIICEGCLEQRATVKVVVTFFDYDIEETREFFWTQPENANQTEINWYITDVLGRDLSDVKSIEVDDEAEKDDA